MNKLTYKIGLGVAGAALLATSFAPAAFAAKVKVSGNGKKSQNTVVVNKGKATVIGQSSNTTANTFVMSVSNTGGNKANGNTGKGNKSIKTGKAKNTTSVSVTGGSNAAVLPEPCGCEDDDIVITGNGKKSKNAVIYSSFNLTLVGQSAETEANTAVVTVANTGDNKANDNTGKGGVDVQTGNAVNNTSVIVEGGSNTLN